jgi:16S rRNA (uracil1498-N3)-methyltransferase
MITLLTTSELLAEGQGELRVEGDAYRHLFRARRVAVGDAVRVVDGRETARWAQVQRVERSAAWLSLGGPAPDHEPAFHLTLCVPTCRPEPAAWLVEKGTEIGVVRIAFLHTERAPRDFGAGTLERLHRVAAAAVEQCHRTRRPEILGPLDWSQLKTLSRGAGRHWVLDTAPSLEGGDPWDGRGAGSGAGSGILLVGPEGGWSERERGELRSAGFSAVHLGQRVLRLETAAIAGAALLLLNPTS